jgi:hypothetical protein
MEFCRMKWYKGRAYACTWVFPCQKIIHPRDVSRSVKRATGRSSPKHDNFESRVMFPHLPWTCLKRGKISSFTFAFPFISIHMKCEEIVRVPAGPFRCPVNYFLLCFNRPKCPEMQRISYNGVEQATAEHVARECPVGQTSPQTYGRLTFVDYS